jgi:hypothetical protein
MVGLYGFATGDDTTTLPAMEEKNASPAASRRTVIFLACT